MAALTLKFDSTLGYQTDAINAIVDLFDGLPVANAAFALTSQTSTQLPFSELGVANPAPEDDDALAELVLGNLRAVQDRNGLAPSKVLTGRDFTVEMETGTGKTYVYLRTIFELHRKHGFAKFVIVVPSVAIREGVLASIDLLRDHLRSMYNQPFDAAVYDSKQLGRVRQFATANTVQILVMNIQAFQKDVEEADDPAKANIINRRQDRMSGHRPIDFIQNTRPVVIIDEPQNMESTNARTAIARLRPFCTLRYSATHKTPHHRVYRLGPIEAYDLKLVKQIEVASVVPDDDHHTAFVRLLQVDAARTRAQIEYHHGAGTAVKTKKAWVKRGHDLSVLSDGRQEYTDGWIVDDIHFRAGAEAVDFSNGAEVTLAAPSGAYAEDTRRAQVFETVRQHLDKEKSLAPLGVKVLSLFFLDKVANYRGTDADGNPVLGEIGRWFEEAYAELSTQKRYASLDLPPVEKAHGGYFSVDNKNNFKDTRGTGEADSSTYDLIMRDKQKLLSADEPLRFLFSHSALREGWDNPNVFQICTLNESRSVDRKRQEIGRGLRLPVNQNGDRIHDVAVNRLTIIANESYKQFAAALQKEYEEDTGRRFGLVGTHAFARLPDPDDIDLRLGTERSTLLWEHLRDRGYLDKDGAVVDAVWPQNPVIELDVPDHLVPVRAEIVDTLKAFMFGERVQKADREVVTFRKEVTHDPDFQALWERISRRTRYRVHLDSDQLVADVCARIGDAAPIGPPKIRVRVVDVEHSAGGIRADRVIDQREYDTARPAVLPDILADLQNETDLTRRTLVRILTGCGRLDDFLVNPQAFLSLVTSEINAVLRAQLVNGLTYEPVPGLAWEMRRLEPETAQEIQRYANKLYKVRNGTKSPYDHVQIDSEVERGFAKQLDDSNSVRLFMKLPAWFTIDTPVGTYNPDWALVMEPDDRVYLVRETKSSLDEDERRPDENRKIECARKHFAAITVNYNVARHLEDVLADLTAGG